VRSAYHLQKEVVQRKMTTSSLTMGRSAFWKRLWALSVPNVEKKFLWAGLSKYPSNPGEFAQTEKFF
jgi:hypothetical protein